MSCQFGIILYALLTVATVHAKNFDCGKLQSDFLNLVAEMNQEFKKTKAASEIMEKNKNKLDQLINQMGAVGESHPECRASFEFAAQEGELMLRDIRQAIPKKVSESVSYDEWFTLQSTGIKSGKKYSFIGCVIGPRNATAVRCHTPGTAAKRVFYNLDDIQSQEMKQKWVNTNNKDMCVTAYVTGGEAFIVSITDPNNCQ